MKRCSCTYNVIHDVLAFSVEGVHCSGSESESERERERERDESTISRQNFIVLLRMRVFLSTM